MSEYAENLDLARRYQKVEREKREREVRAALAPCPRCGRLPHDCPGHRQYIQPAPEESEP